MGVTTRKWILCTVDVNRTGALVRFPVRQSSRPPCRRGAGRAGRGGDGRQTLRSRTLPGLPDNLITFVSLYHNGHASDGGAHHWAIVASLVATAKLNGIEPQAWLTDVLERMVSGRIKAHELTQLLPPDKELAGVQPVAPGHR